MGLLVILLLAILIVGIVCAFKESSVTTPYKENGVYGRAKAYFALDLTVVGIIGTIAMVVVLIMSAFNEMFRESIGTLLICLAICIVCLLIGISIYKSTYKKCPAYLKDKCIKSMLITGMGVAVKLGFFFFKSVWAYTGSGTYQGGGYSSRYIRQKDNEHFYVVSNNGNYVVMQAVNGSESVSARSNGDERIWDDAGNLYYPDN